jgi:GT2 family glycosyltransferase
LDVIVPVYNQRPLVESCLASVLAARNAAAFELVVVDDASTDRELSVQLAKMAEAGELTLLTNTENLGFTKSVNRGMRLHPGRDVLLLNSDVVVHGDWLDRLREAAYSDPRIATVNPLTNASHIGCYPFRQANGHVTFEISDERLDALAAEVNRTRRVGVHTTVGFCLYIRRAVLDAIGYFDAVHFPFGYGEESDFCYRARKLGWRHVVAGNVFVRHWEGQSFGERKARLVDEMIGVFRKLHPDLETNDRAFARSDPIRPLREALDLGRLRLLLAGATAMRCFSGSSLTDRTGAAPAMLIDPGTGSARIAVPGFNTMPNLPTLVLPGEIAAFNTTLARLGIHELQFAESTAAESFAALMSGRPMDLGLTAEITVIEGN